MQQQMQRQMEQQMAQMQQQMAEAQQLAATQPTPAQPTPPDSGSPVGAGTHRMRQLKQLPEEVPVVGTKTSSSHKKEKAAVAAVEGAAPKTIGSGSKSQVVTGSGGDKAEKRNLVVQFTDLAGSTAMSEALDAEDVREIVMQYQKMAGAVIKESGGHIAQVTAMCLLLLLLLSSPLVALVLTSSLSRISRGMFVEGVVSPVRQQAAEVRPRPRRRVWPMRQRSTRGRHPWRRPRQAH